MERYIDAEKFDSRVRVAGGFAEEELTEDFKDGVLTVLEMLKTAPTADVRENVRGEWIDNGIDPGAWNFCSVCGEQSIDLYDFCPNCGADMRGVKE